MADPTVPEAEGGAQAAYAQLPRTARPDLGAGTVRTELDRSRIAAVLDTRGEEQEE